MRQSDEIECKCQADSISLYDLILHIIYKNFCIVATWSNALIKQADTQCKFEVWHKS